MSMGHTKRLSTRDQAYLPKVGGQTPPDLSDALAPLDQVAAKMEAKWGCDRLPRLVSTDLAARFGSARQKLDEAIRANDPDLTARRAEVLIRGWQALDQAATEAGHTSMPPDTWSVRHGERTYTVVLNRRDHDIVARLSPTPENVVTINELLLAWSQWAPAAFAEQVKAHWPGAEARTARSERSEVLDDEIPF